MALISLFGCGADGWIEPVAETPQDTMVAFSYSPLEDQWNDTVRFLSADGSSPGRSTIVVQLEANEPIKEIGLREVLLNDSPSEPTLEIAGSNDPHGEIHICKLIIRSVTTGGREGLKVNQMNLPAASRGELSS